jgi:hypothetical protein
MKIELPHGTPAEVFVPALSVGDVSITGGYARFHRAEGAYCIYDVDPGTNVQNDVQNVVFNVQPARSRKGGQRGRARLRRS